MMTVSPPEKDDGASILMHAEFLPNIRQVALYISLPESNRFNHVLPKVFLSESYRSVTVSYPEPFGNVTETIKLPARIAGAFRRELKINEQAPQGSHDMSHTNEGRRELSFRMPLDGDCGESRDDYRINGGIVDDCVPWTASDMSPSTKIRCKECENIFLDKPKLYGNTKASQEGWTWKDLPSGNWAEMMDFWHCHKPDPPKDASRHDNEDNNSLVKGYGATNCVVATAGAVLVDVATLLVTRADCIGLERVEIERKDSSRPADIICSRCRKLVGTEDVLAAGWRLFKTNLAANSQPEKTSIWETHSAEIIVAAQLLELIERESARRFVVHCGEKSGLLLWVFNPDLRYSSSSIHYSNTDQRAMKVLFQDISDVEELLYPGPGRTMPLYLGELELPVQIFHVVSDTLASRNYILPLPARMFHEWKVGLLNRFDREKNDDL